MLPAPDSSSTFGTTIMDALQDLEGRGYKGGFRVAGPQEVQCLTCRRTQHAIDVTLDLLVRIEGVSDPADEDAVVGLVCPACKSKGTLIFTYGANASAEEALVLQGLQDRRRSE